jgi:uncharacterized membrane protein HdeD (DUF308 family)
VATFAFQIGEEVAMATTSAHDRYPGPAGYAAGPDTLGAALARNWWLIALRGVLGVVFGLIALLMPVATILALVLLFSAYMLVDGAFAIYAAIRAGQRGDSWGLLAFQGIASLVAGVLAFLWPGITVLAFVLLIAAWSIVTGCVMLAAALATEQARWWLVVGGAAAMLFGILMIVAPLAGAVVLTWWLGAYALVFGVALIILAFKLRSRYLAGYQDRGTAASARPAA